MKGGEGKKPISFLSLPSPFFLSTFLFFLFLAAHSFRSSYPIIPHLTIPFLSPHPHPSLTLLSPHSSPCMQTHAVTQDGWNCHLREEILEMRKVGSQVKGGWGWLLYFSFLFSFFLFSFFLFDHLSFKGFCVQQILR